MAVTLDSFSNQLEIIQKERFSGLLTVMAAGVQQWEIFFHIGDIVWVRGGEHWRRWRRMLDQFGVCVPIGETEEISSNDYKQLVGWVQSDKLLVEQASALIGSTINEVLFEIFQQENLAIKHGGRLSFEREPRKILPKCLKLVGTKLAATQAKDEWQQWCDRGLFYVSPNWVFSVACQAQVRHKFSRSDLELLELIDGCRSLRDLAVLSGQPLVNVALLLYKWFERELIDLNKPPDLHPLEAFVPLSENISRAGKNLLSQNDERHFDRVSLPVAEPERLNEQAREQVLFPNKPRRSFRWLLLLIVSLVFGSGYLLIRTQNGSVRESAIALTNTIEWSSLIPSTKNNETVELKVLGDTFSGYSLLRDALFEQELQAYGIDFRYQHEFNQQRRAALLSEGQGDLAVTTIDQFLLWQPKARIVGLVDRSQGGDAIVLNTKQYPQLRSLASLSQVQESAQQQGKPLTIVLAGSTPSEYLTLLAQTKFGGLDLVNFQVRKVEDASIAWQLLQDRKENIALAVLWEPFVSQASSRGYSIAFSSRDVPNKIVDVIIASDRILKEHPEKVSAFLSAFYSRQDASLRNPSMALESLAQNNKLSKQDAVAVLEGIDFFTATEAKSWMQNGTLEKILGSTAGVLAWTGQMNRPLPTDFSGQYSSEFIGKAAQNTHRLIQLVRQSDPPLADALVGNKKTSASKPQYRPLNWSGQKVRMEVKFESSSAMLTPQGKQVLAVLAQELQQFEPKTTVVRVVGHTSVAGDPSRNQLLSQQRAEVVANYLRSRYNLKHQILALGKGSSLALPGTNPNDSQNQRTEIVVLKRKADYD